MLAITSSKSRLPLIASTDSHQIIDPTEVQLSINICPLKVIQKFADQRPRVAALNGYFIQSLVIIAGALLSALLLNIDNGCRQQ